MGVEIIGHRGASYDAPENTLASVNLAWRRNADAVEIDVFLTKDGQIVAIHDETTKKLAGVDRRVEDQTLAELKALDVGRWKGKQWTGERIPTLAEVLATVPKRKRLFIEVKCGPEIIPKLNVVLRKAKIAPSQTVIIGFSLKTMSAIKRELPKREVCWVVEQKQHKITRRWQPTADQIIRKAKAAGLDGLDLKSNRAINNSAVTKVKRAGLKLYVWTVNSPQQALRLQSLGGDGITTDRPGWLRQQLQKQAEPTSK